MPESKGGMDAPEEDEVVAKYDLSPWKVDETREVKGVDDSYEAALVALESGLGERKDENDPDAADVAAIAADKHEDESYTSSDSESGARARVSHSSSTVQTD